MKMRITIGEHYRHKNTPNYGWARAIRIIKPHIGVNKHNYPIVECEWALDQHSSFGLIKYFKLSDLITEQVGSNDNVKEGGKWK